MSFEEWTESIIEDFGIMQTMLQKVLPDAPEQLADVLRETEAWHARLTTMLASANRYLDQAEYTEGRRSECSDESMLERKMRVRGAVAEERQTRNTIDGLCEAVRTRIMLGMSLLKASSGERIANAAMEKTF